MLRLLIVVVLFSSMHVNAEQTLRFGLRTGLPTTYYTESVPPKGIFPDLINAALAPLDVNLEYQINPRRRLMHQMMAGDIHMTTLPAVVTLAGHTSLPKGLTVNKEPLLTYNVNLYKLASNSVRIEDKSQLAGLRIGTTRHPKFMLKAMRDYLAVEVEMPLFGRSESLLKALLTNRIDFALLSVPEKVGLLRQFPTDINIDIAYSLGKIESFLVFSEAALGQETAAEYAQIIDQRILQLQAEGQLQRIYEKYDVPFLPRD